MARFIKGFFIYCVSTFFIYFYISFWIPYVFWCYSVTVCVFRYRAITVIFITFCIASPFILICDSYRISIWIIIIWSYVSVYVFWFQITFVIIFISDYCSVRILLFYSSVFLIIMIYSYISVMVFICRNFVFNVIIKIFCFTFFICCWSCQQLTAGLFFTILKLYFTAVTFYQFCHMTILIIFHSDCIPIGILYLYKLISVIFVFWSFCDVSDVRNFAYIAVFICKLITFFIWTAYCLYFPCCITVYWNPVSVSVCYLFQELFFTIFLDGSVFKYDFISSSGSFTPFNDFICRIFPDSTAFCSFI